MFGLGTWEILLILIAALVFIGPSKLPSLARTMGKGMRDVRRAMAGFEDEVRRASTVPEGPAEPQAAQEAEDRAEDEDHDEGHDEGHDEADPLAEDETTPQTVPREATTHSESDEAASTETVS